MRYQSNSSIFLVSRPSEVFTSFRGPLLSFSIVQSINREKGTLRRWIFYSQGRRSTLVRYLFGKMLWDELNSIEIRVFWSLPEVTSDRTIYLSLKALALGVDKKSLRNRLQKSPFKELKFITRQSYLTLKGRVNFFLFEEEVNLRKVPKFSGYTRHHKDKGSLGTEREYYLSEILDPYEDVEDELILQYLVVGEFSLFGGEISYPDENKRVRNEKARNSK